MTRKLEWSILILSIVGIIDTAYLSYARYTSSELSCGVLEGCSTVAKSEYSVLFGILPLAYLGLVFYLAVFVISLFLLRHNNHFIRGLLLLTTFAGFAMSAYFFYLQGLVIKAFCIYCLISALVSALLFFVSLRVYRGGKELSKVAEES